jgi:hypothetical protein
LDLPSDWQKADALYISVTDPQGRVIYTWDWKISLPADYIANNLIPDNTNVVTGEEQDELILMKTNDLEVLINKLSGILYSINYKGKKISLSGGPELSEGNAEFVKYESKFEGDACIYKAFYSGNLNSITWTLNNKGILKLDVVYVPNNYQPFFGINFDYPEKLVKGVKWLGDGPYRVWKNRMKGVRLNIWEKDYNNTITGETYTYPEFKGYHSNMYWLKLINEEKSFTVFTATENLFFRLYTPDDPTADPRYTKVKFPQRDISFLQGINAIGTKFKKPELLGPQSQMNMYRRHRTDKDLHIELYFDFK